MFGFRRHRQWEKRKAILRQALNAERDRVGSEQAATISSFIEHDEMSLAREQILDALSDLELDPREETVALLAEEARLTR